MHLISTSWPNIKNTRTRQAPSCFFKRFTSALKLVSQALAVELMYSATRVKLSQSTNQYPMRNTVWLRELLMMGIMQSPSYLHACTLAEKDMDCLMLSGKKKDSFGLQRHVSNLSAWLLYVSTLKSVWNGELLLILLQGTHSPSELLEENTNVHAFLGVENGHLATEKNTVWLSRLTITDCYNINIHVYRLFNCFILF